MLSVLLITGGAWVCITSAVAVGLGSPGVHKGQANINTEADRHLSDDSQPGSQNIGPCTAATGSTPGCKAGPPRCLEVRPSKIPNAGDGLFATCNMKAGTSIGKYYGRVSEEIPADTTYAWRVPMCRDAHFAVHLNHQNEFELCAPVGWHYIDGKDFPTSAKWTNPLRFANSIPSPAMRGSINLEPRFQEGEVFYDLLRDVQTGDELLVDYGANYWTSRDGNHILMAIVIGVPALGVVLLSVVGGIISVFSK